jgi:hypothetical protein
VRPRPRASGRKSGLLPASILLRRREPAARRASRACTAARAAAASRSSRSRLQVLIRRLPLVARR